VGTKADKGSERQVGTEEGRKLARQHDGMAFMEVSAKNREQVKDVFITVTDRYLQSKGFEPHAVSLW